jgi:hypothetical protein
MVPYSFARDLDKSKMGSMSPAQSNHLRRSPFSEMTNMVGVTLSTATAHKSMNDVIECRLFQSKKIVLIKKTSYRSS